MKRGRSRSRIKSRRSYNVHEAAEVCGVHRETVRNWMKRGLRPVEGIYPALFLGWMLTDWLAARSKARKKPCPPGHLYCFKCKVPRRPDPGLVEYAPAAAGAGNIRGLCPECATVMNRRASAAAFDTFSLAVAAQAESRLRERTPPRLNADSERADR